MPPSRGRGGRSRGRRANTFDIDYEFELFTLDEHGNLRTPDENENLTTSENGESIANVPTSFTFAGAIENFAARFQENSGAFGFEIINVTDRLAATNELPTSFFPLTLDLTARYLTEGSSITLPDGTPVTSNISSPDFPFGNVDVDRIEYVLTNEVLENLRINELTLVLEDADGDNTNGFQIDEDFVTNGFQLGGQTVGIDQATIDVVDGISDIEYIVDNNLLGLNNLTRVSGVSENDFNQIVSDESLPDLVRFSPLIIEAEDLNLDNSNYLIENYAEGGEGEQLISLLDATRNPATAEVTGEASLSAADFDLGSSGGTDYDLTINYFDENDGEANFRVLVNGIAQGEPLVLNENTSSGLPTEDIRRQDTIRLEGIATDDTITIQGTSNQFEQGRIDFIILEEIAEF